MKHYCLAAMAASLLTVPAFAQSDTDAAAGVTLRTPAGIQQDVADPGNFGGDFGREAFWSSARNLAGNHNIWGFDSCGVLTVGIDQVPGAWGSAWGYRDGCSSAGFMYFGWEDGLARHDDNGSNGVQIIVGPAPGGVGTWRALAFDPTGDGGAGSIWTQSFISDVAEVSLSGALLTIFPNRTTSAYGLAYDDADGNLWVHTTGGEVVKMDTATGRLTGAGWTSGFPNLAAQGGLSGLHNGTGHVYAVSQGTPDEAGRYNTIGTLVGGPWDMEGQTGSNGHLGIAAVVTGPTAFAGTLTCVAGTATLKLTGGTPYGCVAILASETPGPVNIPLGRPCATTSIGTKWPFLFGTPRIVYFDADGDFSATAGGLPCATLRVSAVDLTTCEVLDY